MKAYAQYALFFLIMCTPLIWLFVIARFFFDLKWRQVRSKPARIQGHIDPWREYAGAKRGSKNDKSDTEV